MGGYKKLKVWELSHELTLDIYQVTKQFPNEEIYAMVSQLRRAAYSVPSNIVEGKSRGTEKEFRRFLTIARGSIDEVSYFLLLSKDLGYISHSEFETLVVKSSHIAAMLNNLIKKVNQSI